MAGWRRSSRSSAWIAALAPKKVALTGGLAALFGLNLRDELLTAPGDDEVSEPIREALEVKVAGTQVDKGADAAPAIDADGGDGVLADDAGPAHQDATPDVMEPPVEVRRDYLKFIGIRSRTIDIWVREGVLLPTDCFHVYLRTPEANRRIAGKLAH